MRKIKRGYAGMCFAFLFVMFQAGAQTALSPQGGAVGVLGLDQPPKSGNVSTPVATASSTGDNRTAESPLDPANALSSLETKCVLVRDMGIFLGNPPAPGETAGDPLTTGKGGATLETSCGELGLDAGALIGTGDLVIGVDKTAFKNAQESKRGVQGEFILFLNGVPLHTDATVLATEEVGSLILLRFRIRQGAETQKLWSMLFADGALFAPQTLYAALGWRSTAGNEATMIPVRSKSAAQVSITTDVRFGIAVVLVLLSIGMMFYLGMATDVLRDAPDSQIPQWLAEARRLNSTLRGLSDDAARDSHLAQLYSTYFSQPRSYYLNLAKLARKGQAVEVKDIDATTIGLALGTGRWKTLRASFSLSRTQMVLWFTFAIATGVFLWLLYGDLRRIDGSLLVLLGISVGTAGTSWLIDRSANSGRPYSPSRGFLSDLLTGFDEHERKQLHRYQAVVVNILLLVVGIFQVVQQLSYPVFDSTWLIFLGISGSTYGVGKQVLEK